MLFILGSGTILLLARQGRWFARIFEALYATLLQEMVLFFEFFVI